MRSLGKFITAWHLARSYLRGWRCRQKLVVLESDDWGSIRTSSREAYDQLVAAGYAMDRSLYCLDALECPEDLAGLMEVLGSFRDPRGRSACMTANVVVANPDFQAIRRSELREYHYEPMTATLSRYPGREDLMRRWQEGMKRGMFLPQLHAREHVRWWEWLEALRRGSPEALETFRLEMCGVPIAASRERLGFFAPLYLGAEELARHGVDLGEMVRGGAELFRRQFGFASLSTVAPNYAWTDRTEELWAECGVRYVQGDLLRICYTAGGPVRRPRFLGQRSAAGCWQLVRNCAFEPAIGGADWVRRCLRQMARAFRFHKPAVVCTHRANYVGSIRPENRSNGLARLGELLREVRRRWPDAFFLSSVELGRMVERKLDTVQRLEEGETSDGPFLAGEARGL